jgi:phenylalanyl-tRNA synthetase, beta subunit, non-spirochete bacterial
MRISIQWLRDRLDFSWNTEEVARRLTMGGIEVEAIEPAALPFHAVVVAAVQSVAAHPEADKLRVAQVDAGDGTLRTIVCGAANLAEGQRVPLALPGAELPGNKKIAISELRGVRSEGMLCAAGELGLEDGSSGLLILDAEAPVGADLRTYLHLDDEILTLGITPNRGDALSIKGVARDLYALGAQQLHDPRAVTQGPEWSQQDSTQHPVQGDYSVSIEAEARTACPSYTALWIDGVPNRLPDFLRERLRRAGQRSIHPMVDLLNLWMFDTGQPLHAFDADTIQGGLCVRWAKTGEVLDALDGRDLNLEPDMLVIADAQGPVALAGIIGGRRSSVTAQTCSIILEAAFFQPKAIQGRARRLGLQTDAAMRYERGVDFNLAPQVARGVLAQMMELAAVQLRVSHSFTLKGQLPASAEISLRQKRLERVMGMPYEAAVVEQLLTRLGLQIRPAQDGWQATAPSHRFDLRIEADLIEEVGRIYGYDHLPAHRPRGILQAVPDNQSPSQLLRHILQARDYHEVITYSFISQESQDDFQPNADAPALLNPLSADLAVMRASLWPGLLQTLQFNAKRQQDRIRLFEMGRIFSADRQSMVLAGCIWGAGDRENWAQTARDVDFFDLKGDVAAILALWPQTHFEFQALSTEHALHPGQAAEILVEGRRIGMLGALHPTLAARYDLDKSAFFFYLDIEMLEHLQKGRHFTALSPYPALRRDMALVIPDNIEAGAVLAAMQQAAGTVVQEIRIFDRYQGESLPAGTYSLAFALILQDRERTLTEADVQMELERMLTAVKQIGSIELRA